MLSCCFGERKTENSIEGNEFRFVRRESRVIQELMMKNEEKKKKKDKIPPTPLNLSEILPNEVFSLIIQLYCLYVYYKQNHEQITKEWTKYLEKDGIKLFINTSTPSGVSQSLGNYKFKGDFSVSPSDMITALWNKDFRLSWDQDLLEFTSVRDEPYGEVYYMLLKFPFPFKNRDFVNRIYFLKDEDGNDVVIEKSLEDNEYPLQSGIKRGKTIHSINFYKVENDENGNKYLNCLTYNKTSFNTVIPKSFINSFLPAKAEKWYSGMKEYVNENFKRLE